MANDPNDMSGIPPEMQAKYKAFAGGYQPAKEKISGPETSQESAQKSSVDIANVAAKMVNHAAQGHQGDPATCPDCGFDMSQTAIDPSIAKLKQGIQGQ